MVGQENREPEDVMPFYNSYKKDVLDGAIDLVAITMRAALMLNTYVPDIDTDQFWDDVSASEASGSGYAAGGASLEGKSTAQDDTDDEGVFDANNTIFPNITITTRFVVFYEDTGVAATSRLIRYVDFGSDQSPSGEKFTLQYAAEGIINAN